MKRHSEWDCEERAGRGTREYNDCFKGVILNNAYSVCYKITNVSILKPVCFIPAYGKDNCDLIAKLPEN